MDSRKSMQTSSQLICGTFTKLVFSKVLPFLSEDLVHELDANSKFHLRLRTKLRAEFCLDCSTIVSVDCSTLFSNQKSEHTNFVYRRVFGLVYKASGRELVDLSVELELPHRPHNVRVNHIIPLPARLQSGLLSMAAFLNASEEFIIVFADRIGSGIYTPENRSFRSNYNQGALWTTRYHENKGKLEIISVTSRFHGRKPKRILLSEKHNSQIFVEVNENEWLQYSIEKEIDPQAETHLQHLLREMFGVSAKDANGWLSPHVMGEIDDDLFGDLVVNSKPWVYEPTCTKEATLLDISEVFSDMSAELNFDDLLPSWMLDDLNSLGPLDDTDVLQSETYV